MAVLQTFKKHKGAFYVSAAVNVGSILFGFDTGVAGAIVALASFKKDFHLATDPTKLAYTSGNIVALLNAGAFFGAIVPALFSRWIGRRHLLAVAGGFFLLGGTLQTAAQAPSLAMIYAGRVLAGFGVGMISNTAPVFVAECAPKELRGVMMSMFEMFLVSGGMLSYWTTYGCSVHLPATSKQWRIPLSLQIILAALVVLSSFGICESPRWLAKKGRWDEAASTLAHLRGAAVGDLEIIEELAEMRAQLDEEVAQTNGRSIKEMFTPKNFQRLLWGLTVALFAMWCGHNAILYYGPSVFKQIGYTSQNAALLASGVFTCLKFASTIIFIAGGVNIFKRKTMLGTGAFFMGAFLFALGAILKSFPPTKPGNGSGSSSAQAMMALIYLFVVAYSLSWGPLQWVYMGEIFPMRLRDYGMAMCAMMTWLMNYVVSKIAPIAILNIGWKTWMIFGTMNIAAAIFSVFLPETKNLGLEEMDVLFGVVEQEVRTRDVEANISEKVNGGNTAVEKSLSS
ncbi:sugar transporter-2 [Coleophoma crateriformis]|uniref:Sugar transporter-2 n=1 Tax=Coleophoma crateriformis TaxID=565419 RepID=A0A3D8RQ65_9HELO|nr:sugar transporter-2 [Coleophoma crateriformis]